jgi:hypothetical protein
VPAVRTPPRIQHTDDVGAVPGEPAVAFLLVIVLLSAKLRLRFTRPGRQLGVLPRELRDPYGHGGDGNNDLDAAATRLT